MCLKVNFLSQVKLFSFSYTGFLTNAKTLIFWWGTFVVCLFQSISMEWNAKSLIQDLNTNRYFHFLWLYIYIYIYIYIYSKREGGKVRKRKRVKYYILIPVCLLVSICLSNRLLLSHSLVHPFVYQMQLVQSIHWYSFLVPFASS